MLTMPETIKTLFKTDGVFHNFRAHFPNGERADITNSDIVRESLKFTESLCSDDVFRFGGCERSVIQFETVGVENILGAVIECGIEIDTTSLSAAQLSAIAADPGDGVLVSTADSDIGRGYYRVPLGTFKVASCPRDHRAMAHRAVTAYSPKFWRLSPIEAAKQTWWSRGSKYTVNAQAYILANIGYYAPELMGLFGWTRSAASLPTPTSGTYTSTGLLKDVNGDNVAVNYTCTMRRYRLPFGRASDSTVLGAVELGDIDAAGLVAFVKTALEEAKVDFAASGAEYGFEQIRSADDFIRLRGGDFAPSLTWYDTPMVYTRAVLSGDAPVVSAQGPRADDAKMQAAQSVNGSLSLYVPESVTISVSKPVGAVEPYSASFSTGIGDVGPSAYVWTKSDTGLLDGLTLGLPSTGAVTWTDPYGTDYTFHRWSDSSDVARLASGWMELQGMLMGAGRGSPRRVTLDSSSPAALVPGDYEQVWWDDYSISPVGRVLFTYGKEHDRAGWVSMDFGESVYDLTDNAVLTAIDASADQIAATILDGMTDALAGLGGYTPAEISMPAWPWLEPGDCVSFTGEDNATVTTYIMRRTMSGVQLLMDSIEAPGGVVEDDDG